MAIKIKFDNTYNVITPTFVLATRGGDKLGDIPAVNISMADSFNDKTELTFKVKKFSNGVEYANWDKLVDFKLAWCKEWDIWFEIQVQIDEESDTTKVVTCTSIGEAELSQTNIFDVEINTEDDIARDDYEVTTFYNEDNPDASLLHRIMEKVPHYSIKYVAPSLRGLQRTFSFDSISIYDAFQEISEEVDCIFIIDSGTNGNGEIARTVSVYDLESYCMECGERGVFTTVCSECGSDNILLPYGNETAVYVSVDNLADNITYSGNPDSVKNCFRLEAGDDLMTAAIIGCNPNGGQYIWCISDETKEDMPEELVAQLAAYDADYDYYRNEYEIIPSDSVLSQYNSLVVKYQNMADDLHVIEDSIVGYSELMNVYYDTIDFAQLLRSGLMPSSTLDDTSATNEASKLTSAALSPVAVENLNTCSSSTASNAVLAMAKTIVDSRYQVKVKDGSYSSNSTGGVWSGSFTVTNYSDDEDTAESAELTVSVNSDVITYTKQKLKRVLDNESDDSDITDIATLFESDYSSFCAELQKYCLTGLGTLQSACQSCLDAMIEMGVSDGESDLYNEIYSPYYNKMLAVQAEIKLREQEIAYITGSYDSDGNLVTTGMQTVLDEERSKIQAALDFQQYLGDDLWLEFAAYRREDVYQNDNYISDGLSNSELFANALEFIKTAEYEIYKSATQQHSITATLKNLLMMEEFQPIVDDFSVGSWIHVMIDDIVYKLRLIYYSIDFDNPETLSVEFSDVQACIDGFTDTRSILSQAESMASSYGTVTRQANKGSKSKEQLQDWVDKGLALTNLKIISNVDNQNVSWDEHGFLCREYDEFNDVYSDKQLKIINKGLYLTDDGWLTAKAGIGNFTMWNPMTGQVDDMYGVIADTIVGNIILSEKVGIYNTQNSIVMDENGFVMTVDASDENTNNTVFTIQQLTGYDANGDEIITKVLWVDDNGLLHIKGDGAGLDISATESITSLSENVASLKLSANEFSTNLQKVTHYATTHYGTCTTASDNAEKIVSCTDFELYSGANIAVYFTNGNTAGSPTLTINNGTDTIAAMPIMLDNSALTTDSESNWYAGATVYFVYDKDSSVWRIADSGSLKQNELLSSRITQTAERIDLDVSTVRNYATIHYCTCETEAGTSAKVAVCSNFALYTGAMIAVYFTQKNTASDVTLNVNNTGELHVYCSGSPLEESHNWDEKDTVHFVYDGTNWVIVDSGLLKKTESLSASLSLTAEAITAEVTRATESENSLSTSISSVEQTADGVSSRVTTIEEDYVTSTTLADTKSDIEEGYADAISASESKITTNYTSAISQSKDSILTTVSETYATSDSLTEATTSITQTVNSIETKVTGYTAHYGTCDTDVMDSPKVVKCDGFELYTGAIINVTFGLTNTANAPTMIINDDEDSLAAIMAYGKRLNLKDLEDGDPAKEANWDSGATVTFCYDGKYWQLVDSGSASKYSSIKQTVDSIDLSAETIRMTATTLMWSATNSSLTKDGTLTCSNAVLSGSMTTESDLYKTVLDSGGLQLYYDSTLYGTISGYGVTSYGNYGMGLKLSSNANQFKIYNESTNAYGIVFSSSGAVHTFSGDATFNDDVTCSTMKASKYYSSNYKVLEASSTSASVGSTSLPLYLRSSGSVNISGGLTISTYTSSGDTLGGDLTVGSDAVVNDALTVGGDLTAKGGALKVSDYTYTTSTSGSVIETENNLIFKNTSDFSTTSVCRKRICFEDTDGTLHHLIGMSISDTWWLGDTSTALYIRGSKIYMNGSAYSSSDARLKQDIVQLPYCDSLFDTLSPVSYRLTKIPDKIHLGFTTQDVRRALEDSGCNVDDYAIIGSFDDDDTDETYEALVYTELIPVLWKEVQHLRQRIMVLEENI